MTQPEEPNARRKTPAQLCFGSGIDRRTGRRNAARERRVVGSRGVLGHTGSLTSIDEDV